jgi:hypothetical protein
MSEDTTWVTELVSKGLCKVFPNFWEVALVEALSWQEFTHYKDGKVSLSLGVWPDQAWYTRDKKDVRTYDGREPWVGTLVPESQRHRSIADIGLDAVHCKEPKHSRKLMDKQKAELLYLVRDGKVLKEPEPVPPDADLDEMGLVHVPND